MDIQVQGDWYSDQVVKEKKIGDYSINVGAKNFTPLQNGYFTEASIVFPNSRQADRLSKS
jgi:hypothetical protein